MADVRPFLGIRYNPATVADLADVICPPYDIISPSDEEDLLRRHPNNAVSLELRQEQPDEQLDPARYSLAGNRFRRWLDEGVLVRDRSTAMYLVAEEFSHQGKTRSRLGLTAVVRLVAFEEGIVLPHEYTRPGPKADRLAVMKASRANFSPVMALYRDPDGEMSSMLEEARQGPPMMSARPSGQAEYRVWSIAEPGLLSSLVEAMAGRQVFVADGHHRYETALQYRDELEEEPLSASSSARFMMMTLISMDDPGLQVLPYHRTIAGLRDDELGSIRNALDRAFAMEPIHVPGTSPEETASYLESRLALMPKEAVAVAAYGLDPGAAHVLTLRDELRPAHDAPLLQKSDMWLLHEHALRAALREWREAETVSFVHKGAEAIETVAKGDRQLAFLLRPLPMDLFEEVVGKGERLPSKSTYFYPKLPTGLVFNSLEGEL